MGSACCHEAASAQDEDDIDQRPKPGSDCITEQEFVDLVANLSNDPKSAEPRKQVRVSLAHLEAIILEEEQGEEEEEKEASKPARRARDRKATGFVSKQAIEAVSDKVKFDSAEQPADRAKTRKGTGFVSKEALMKALDEVSDDEEEEEEGAAGVAAAPPRVSTGSTTSDGPALKVASKRAEGRKGTGFVSKAQLKKVLKVVGEDEDDD